MANSDIIKSKDVIQTDLFKNSIDSANAFANVIADLEKGLKDLNTESNNFLETNSNPKNLKQLKDITDALDKALKSRKGLLEIEKQADLHKKEQAELLVRIEKLENKITEQQKKKTEQTKILTAEEKAQEAVRKQNAKSEETRHKLLAILEDKEIGREAKILANLQLLRLERAKLTGAEHNYLLEVQRINDAINEENALLSSLSDKQKQAKMNVGNYTESIENAIEKSGLFSGVIGKLTYFVELYEASLVATTIATETSTTAHVASVGAIEAETVATEQLTLAKRVMNAVTSPVGAIIAISAAIAGLIGYVFTINQDFKDWFSNMKAGFKDLLGEGNEFSKLEKMIISLRKEINGLNLELWTLNDNAGDLDAVFNDTTLTLNERTQALKDGIEAQKKAFALNQLIAQKELDIENQRVKANKAKYGANGTVPPELLKAQTDAQIKFNEAKDLYDDYVGRELPKKEREFKEKVIINEIELIRSKKLGADSQVEILKQQVADENILIKQRQESLNDLIKNQNEAQETEIELLTKFNITKEEINELIAEKDAVALAKKLQEYNEKRLGDEASLELAKVVLEAQKNKASQDEAQNKIDEKTLKNKEALAKIENEILQNQLNNDAEIAKLEAEKNKLRVETQKSEALDSFNLFNSEKINLAKDAIDRQAELERLATIKENDAIRKKYEDQKTIIREGIKNKTIEEEIGKAEILKLQQELDIELQKNSVVVDNRKTEFEKQLRLKQQQQIIKEVADLTNNISQQLDIRTNKTNEAKDKEIDKTKTAIDRQRELAEKGFSNQLAFEETQLAKRELQQKELFEKQARQKRIIQLTDAYFNAFNARLVEVGGNPNTAGLRALGDVALAEGISQGVVQFAKDGNNMIQGAGTETSDSIPFMLSKNEAVVKAKENVKHNDAVVSLNAGTFDKDYLHVSQYREATQNIQSNLPNFGNVERLLQKLIDKPTQSIDVDSFGNIRESIIKETQKIVITHKNSKLRL